jgi:hypothetical protein
MTESLFGELQAGGRGQQIVIEAKMLIVVPGRGGVDT